MNRILKSTSKKINRGLMLASALSLVALPHFALAAPMVTNLFQNSPMNAQNHPLHERMESDFVQNEKLKIHMPKRQAVLFNMVPDMVLKHVVIAGNKSIPTAELQGFFDSLMGKKVSIEDILQVNQKLSDLYLKAGYLLSYAYLPKQDFKHGKVHITVVEGSVRDVAIVGDGQDNTLIREYAQKILANKPARTHDIQRNLLLINKIPGYKAHFTLKDVEPKAMTSLSEPADLVLVIKKQKLAANVNFDNYGTKDTSGRYQVSGMAEYMGALNMNEAILVQAGTTNFGPKYIYNATLGYRQPINSDGTFVNLLSTFSSDNPKNSTPKYAHNNHHSITALSISHYPVLKMKESLKVEAGLKEVVAKEFTVPAATTRNSKVLSLELGAEYQIKDGIGGTNTITPAYHRGIGKLSQVKLSTPYPIDKNYNVFKLDYFRDQPIAGDFSAALQVSGVYSNDDTPAEEYFAIGGKSIGRAYANSLLTSNRGFNAALELRYSQEFASEFLTNGQVYGFYDIAGAPKSQTGANVATLSSLGLGSRVSLGWQISASLEVGVPLRKNLSINSNIAPVPANFIAQPKNKTKVSFMLNKAFSL